MPTPPKIDFVNGGSLTVAATDEEPLQSMTGGGFALTWTPAKTRRLIRARGGPETVADALGMDPRNLQRIYAGKRHASPTLLRRIGELPEAPDA